MVYRGLSSRFLATAEALLAIVAFHEELRNDGPEKADLRHSAAPVFTEPPLCFLSKGSLTICLYH
uniref:Uncharacterized protein n=1 Tax=Physcomitrium patens TaxID=3218 RepID=A0A7I4EC41_PHYPA